jgi:uncharacterized membrane protein YfhO
MRAVPVAAGAHQVVLSYTPPGLRAGLTVSLIATVLVLGLALIPARRRRRSQP